MGKMAAGGGGGGERTISKAKEEAPGRQVGLQTGLDGRSFPSDAQEMACSIFAKLSHNRPLRRDMLPLLILLQSSGLNGITQNSCTVCGTCLKTSPDGSFVH